ELLLDLLARERKLRRAACVVAQLLDLAAVAERDDDARGALLENLGELRIDRDRDQAGGGAHALVVDRLLGEGGEERRAVHQGVGRTVGHAELGVLDRDRIRAADALRRIAGDAGGDAGDVADARQEVWAQLEGGVDRGVAEPAAWIKLRLEAALDDVELFAEVVERGE